MKRILCTVMFGAAFAVLVAACAKTESVNQNELETQALAVWIKNNAPNAQKLGDSGIYYEVLDDNGVGSSAKVDVKGKWIDVDYVMRDLEGDIYYSRDENTARLLGAYTPYAHYITNRLYIATKSSATNIPVGLYEAMTNIVPGQMWRLYIPSHLAFGSSGFGIVPGFGSKAMPGNAPVVLDSLMISDIIDNPMQKATEDLAAFVSAPEPEGWGIGPGDSIMKGYYMDIIRRVNDKDTIPMNQNAYVYYKVRFLDGTLLYSNVDTVLNNNFGSVRSGDLTSPISITRMSTTPYNGNQMPAKVFYKVIDRLCYGDMVRLAVSPEYAYYWKFMEPNMDDTQWQSSTNFIFNDLGVDYSEYTADAKDSNFGYASFYTPSTSSSVTTPIAEVKPYTPLVYEIYVVRPDNQ